MNIEVIKGRPRRNNIPYTYTVQTGDTLVTICQKFTGNTDGVLELYEANIDVIQEQNIGGYTSGIYLRQGTQLAIPFGGVAY